MRRFAFVAGMLALVIAVLGAGVGFGDVWVHHRRIERDIAGAGFPQVAQRQMRLEVFRQSQHHMKLAFGASTIPLALGLIAIAMGARATPRSTVRTASAGVLAVVALVVAGLAYRASVAEVPKGRYDFADDDALVWDLARAREQIDTDDVEGCNEFDAALARNRNRDLATIIPDGRNQSPWRARDARPNPVDSSDATRVTAADRRNAAPRNRRTRKAAGQRPLSSAIEHGVDSAITAHTRCRSGLGGNAAGPRNHSVAASATTSVCTSRARTTFDVFWLDSLFEPTNAVRSS